MFEVVVSAKFKAAQGLKSPVRNDAGLPQTAPADGFNTVLRVGIAFDDSQINERGWFVDTDAVELELNAWAEHLASDKWTNLFDFRPTYEQVAKASYETLQPKIPQLAYVELDNKTLGVKTRYSNN